MKRTLGVLHVFVFFCIFIECNVHGFQFRFHKKKVANNSICEAKLTEKLSRIREDALSASDHDMLRGLGVWRQGVTKFHVLAVVNKENQIEPTKKAIKEDVDIGTIVVVKDYHTFKEEIQTQLTTSLMSTRKPGSSLSLDSIDIIARLAGHSDPRLHVVVILHDPKDEAEVREAMPKALNGFPVVASFENEKDQIVESPSPGGPIDGESHVIVSHLGKQKTIPVTMQHSAHFYEVYPDMSEEDIDEIITNQVEMRARASFVAQTIVQMEIDSKLASGVKSLEDVVEAIQKVRLNHVRSCFFENNESIEIFEVFVTTKQSVQKYRVRLAVGEGKREILSIER